MDIMVYAMQGEGREAEEGKDLSRVSIMTITFFALYCTTNPTKKARKKSFQHKF
jgi:hypothetical protein